MGIGVCEGLDSGGGGRVLLGASNGVEDEACRAFSSQAARAAGSMGQAEGGGSSVVLAIVW